MIDSTVARAHQHAAGAAGAKGGRIASIPAVRAGGLTTKIHVRATADGPGFGFVLTPGPARDGGAGQRPDGWLKTALRPGRAQR